MKPDQSAEALKRRLGPGYADLPLYELLEAALAFYADAPAEGLAADEDADMLLFQYGCFDWGGGERFEFDLARQFVDADKARAGAISQLRLTIYFPTDNAFQALGRRNERCGSRAALANFRAAVFTSDAFILAASRPWARVEVEWSPD